MSSAVVQSTRPARVSGVYSDAYTIRNSGTVDVYLGQDSSLTVDTRAFTLTPGSTTTWDGKSELWAITKPVETGELEYIYNANMAFAPGPSTVTATASAKTIVNDTFNTASGGLPGSTVVLFDGDVSEYASVIVRVGDETGGATTDISAISLQWYVGNLLIDEQIPRFTATGRLEYTMPVKAARLVITLINGSLSARPYQVAVALVTGVLERHYLHLPASTSTIFNGIFNTRLDAVRGKYFSFRATSQAAGTMTVLIPHHAGLGRIGRIAHGTSMAIANMTLALAGSNDIVWLGRGSIANPNEYLNQAVTLPEYPLWFQFTNGMAASGAEATISFDK